VLFERARLPLVTINGTSVHTTAGHLHAALLEHVPEVTLESCYAALRESWQEAERQRAIDHREVAAPERFQQFLRCLALDPATCPIGLVPNLLDTHRRVLGPAAEFPAHHGPLLRDLAARTRLGVVSNFDYTPTALDILERAGIADLFEVIVVSDEIGWRKPRPEIFAQALRRLGVAAGEALFVGDRADIDVVGAQRAGMRAVWINRAGEALPPGLRPPEFEIRDLAELRHIIELSG